MVIPRRALCIVPHYFGPNPAFVGGSTDLANRAKRHRIVNRTIRQLRRLSAVIPFDIEVHGLAKASVVPIDVDVSSISSNPDHILWAAFRLIGDRLGAYDYFLVVEDDILVPRPTLHRMLYAAADLPENEILLPNRIVLIAGLPVVVDLTSIPNWTGYSRVWNGQTWHEACNPHSAMLFMSRQQMQHVINTTDFSKPEISIGYYMASCFAKAHRNFRLLRERTWLPRHFVYHQDFSARRKSRSRALILNGFRKRYEA